MIWIVTSVCKLRRNLFVTRWIFPQQQSFWNRNNSHKIFYDIPFEQKFDKTIQEVDYRSISRIKFSEWLFFRNPFFRNSIFRILIFQMAIFPKPIFPKFNFPNSNFPNGHFPEFQFTLAATVLLVLPWQHTRNFGETAFGKLDLGKTDIQENGFRKNGFRKNGFRKIGFRDFGRLPCRGVSV